MTRPRAADDFPMIRARMEELRRERARPRACPKSMSSRRFTTRPSDDCNLDLIGEFRIFDLNHDH